MLKELIAGHKYDENMKIDYEKELVNEHGYLVDEKGNLLHRIKSRIYDGIIPFGWNVHHCDGNKKNNSRENLIQIPEELHNQIHSSYPMNQLPSKKIIINEILHEYLINKGLSRESVEALKELRAFSLKNEDIYNLLIKYLSSMEISDKEVEVRVYKSTDLKDAKRLQKKRKNKTARKIAQKKQRKNYIARPDIPIEQQVDIIKTVMKKPKTILIKKENRYKH